MTGAGVECRVSSDKDEGERQPGPQTESGTFDIWTRLVEGRHEVYVTGDLTAENVSVDLLSVIRSIVEFEPTTVVLDLRDVRHIDLPALHALDDANRLVASYDSHLEVWPPPAGR